MQEDYSTEESWLMYVSLFDNYWNKYEFQLELLAACNGHLDIAKVISYHLGDHSLKWMTSKVPALGDLTPLDCVNNDNLRDRLKVCLRRFPI